VARTEEIRKELGEARVRLVHARNRADEVGVRQHEEEISALEANLARSETLSAKSQSKGSKE
jgi:hypothetical protein